MTLFSNFCWQTYWWLTLKMIQFYFKKSWTETKHEWKVLEEKQMILHLKKSLVLLIEIFYCCVQTEQTRWSHDLNHELASLWEETQEKQPESHLGAAPSWLDNSSSFLIPVRITQLKELHTRWLFYSTLIFAFSQEVTAGGVSGSSSFQSYVWLLIDEDDRPPPRKDFALCFYQLSGGLWSAPPYWHNDPPEFTQMYAFHFFSKMTSTTVNQQKHFTLKI